MAADPDGADLQRDDAAFTADWTFGPLRRLLVSPAFHSMHHSADPREYNGNYGRVLSLWDALFGTFVHADEPARLQGVEGMVVPETLTAQFIHPFRVLAARASQNISTSAKSTCPDGAMWKFFTLRLRIAVDAP